MFCRFYSLVALSIAVGSGVLATPLSDNSFVRRQQHVGFATPFTQGGLAGACGVVHSDSDFIVALPPGEYNNGAHCGKTISITDTQTGAATTGVVADECPACLTAESLDLSLGLFEFFAPLSQGIIDVTWIYE